MKQRTLARAAVAVALSLAATISARAETLVYCSEASPESFNPMLGLGGTTYDANAQIYNRLVELERGSSEIVPALAESWDISKDGLTYTFHLRRGVKWHTRPEFTPTRDFNADDVVFTFDRQRNKDNPYFSVGGGVYEYYDGMGFNELITNVDKVDDYTVRLTLARPDASLLAALTPEPMSIMSAEYADAMLAAGTPDVIDTTPVGTGAFVMIDYQKDSVIRYQAFHDYWARAAGMDDRVAKVENLVFTITPDASVRVAKLRADECQVVRFPNPADVAALKADPNIVTQEAPELYYGYLGYNAQKTPLGDKRVRQALNYATNLDDIMKAVFLGITGQKAAALIPPSLWGSDPNAKPYPYDPEKAKQLLAEAGYPNGFTTKIWAMPVQRPYMPDGERAAELIQADWAAVGVKAEIVTYEWGEYLKRSRDGEHDAVLLGWGYDFADPGQILVLGWTCKAAEVGANRSRWCNPEFDKLVEEAQLVSDQAERTGLYLQAQKIFYEEAPALLIAYPVGYMMSSPKVEGLKPQPVGGQAFFGVSLKQ